MGLPQRFERVRFAAGGAAEGAVAVVTTAPEGEACDVLVVDADGRVLMALEGYRTAGLPQTLPEALVSPLAAALG
jgi:hypothetical protein